MRKAFAVEAKANINEFPEILDLLVHETNYNWKEHPFFIYLIEEEALFAKELLEAADLFEFYHPLFVVANGKKGEAFTDLALELDVDTCCLFASDVTAFSISDGDQNEIQMAKYQFEEHLAFETSENGKDFYFIEKHNQELIQNIAKAYGIDITFALDK